jgi:hypothetical protein
VNPRLKRLLSITLSFSRVTVPVAMVFAGAFVIAYGSGNHDELAEFMGFFIVLIGMAFGYEVYRDAYNTRYG